MEKVESKTKEFILFLPRHTMFSVFRFSVFRYKGYGRWACFLHKMFNIYINIYIYIYIKILSLPKNAYNGKRKSGKVENYP